MSSVWVGNHCVPAQAAPDLVWSSVEPSLSGDGSLHFMVRESDGSWSIAAQSSAGLVSSRAAPQLEMAPCDPVEQIQDGFLLGGLVVLVWVSVFAVRSLRGAL